MVGPTRRANYHGADEIIITVDDLGNPFVPLDDLLGHGIHDLGECVAGDVPGTYEMMRCTEAGAPPERLRFGEADCTGEATVHAAATCSCASQLA